MTGLHKEIVKRFSTVLYAVLGQQIPKNDLDILSYRLLDVLKSEVNLEIYRECEAPLKTGRVAQ